jgi:hypothetical protein
VTTLNRFRDQVLAADPGGNRYAHLSDKDVSLLVADDDALEAAVLGALQQQQEVRARLLDRLGVGAAGALQPPTGAPQAIIWEEGGRVLVQLAREGSQPSVKRVSEAPEWVRGSRSSLAALLTPEPEAAVFESLVRDIEAELGCRLGAQSWNRAELVPAWAW